MTKKERLILARLNQLIRKQKKDYRILWKLNLKLENQHCWDQMLRTEGYVSGLEVGLHLFTEFFKKNKSSS